MKTTKTRLKSIIAVLIITVLAVTCALSLTGCKEENPEVTITVKISGELKTIEVELYPDVAPLSVANFLRYVDEGAYSKVIFHRVIEGFMIQTGGYTFSAGNNLTEVTAHDPIKGEFSENGVTNSLSHKAGVISMARTTVNDSATSQFFICSVDRTDMDGKYAAFGKVKDDKSLAVVQEISHVTTATVSTNLGTMSDFPTEIIRVVNVVRTK